MCYLLILYHFHVVCLRDVTLVANLSFDKSYYVLEMQVPGLRLKKGFLTVFKRIK